MNTNLHRQQATQSPARPGDEHAAEKLMDFIARLIAPTHLSEAGEVRRQRSNRASAPKKERIDDSAFQK